MALFGDTSLLAFAFTAGAFTFFAPCAYPLLPGYVAYYLGRSSVTEAAQRPDDQESTRSEWVAAVFPTPVAGRVVRAVGVGVLVSLGFVLVYGILAGVVAAVGGQVLASISVLELVVGVLLVVIGAAMATGWDPPTPTVQLPERRRSPAAYVGFGVLYAAAAAGCTAPIFTAVSLEALAAGSAMGVGTFGAYALGMSVLMVGVTVATAVGRETLLTRITRRLDRINRAAGMLLVVAGLVEVYVFLVRFDGLALLGV